MKTFLSVLAACGLGFAVAYYMSAKQSEALRSEHARMEAEFQSRMNEMESALAFERNKQPLVETVTTERKVNERRTPAEIIARLLELRPIAASRGPTLRKIIHELEELSELNDASVPAIRNFLLQNTDIDYGVERSSRSDGDERSRWSPWQRSSPTMDFTLPPSLRIGLFDVLKDIGSISAEDALAEVLGSTGRAVEVAYIARMLEDIVPGKYRDVAIAAATDLLRNPLPIDNPNRLDEQAESYLYGVLDMYGDTSFIVDAKNMLVSADGRLNRNAQQYLSKVQGEQVVATFYDLYKNNTISNNWDRMSLGNRILEYAGPNAQANAFLSEVVTNPDIDSRMKSFAVLRLAGGFERSESPSDPNIIRARMVVVESLKPNVTDERVLQVLNLTGRNLQNLLDGKPVENPWSNLSDRGSERGR